VPAILRPLVSTRELIAACAVFAFASAARAEPVAVSPPRDAPEPQAPLAPEGNGPRWDGRRRDAHVDRVVLLPTAETQPEGAWTFSSYDIAVLQAGHALTDRSQLTLTVLPVPGEDPLGLVDATLKVALARDGKVRVAGLGSTSGILGFEDGVAFIGRVGGVTQLCFDDDCRSSANVAATLGILGPVLLLANGVGLVLRTSDLAAFLFEMQSLVPLGRGAESAHGLGAAAGLRLAGERWGVDLALQGILDRDGSKPPVIPIIVGTYRFTR
jgi:hypothetical protein